MVVTLAQPGPPASVNITAAEIVLYEPCMEDKTSWVPNRSRHWISISMWRKQDFHIVRCSESNDFLLEMLWILSSTMLITIPQGKLHIIEWKPQQAHLWWLHDDIGWRLSDVYGLHLPPLFFNCLSCTSNEADRCLMTIYSEYVLKEHHFSPIKMSSLKQSSDQLFSYQTFNIKLGFHTEMRQKCETLFYAWETGRQ